MSAQEVLRMATLGGAEVMGLDDRVGSLEAGKRADIAIVDATGPHMRPRTDPATALVYSAEAADVRHVLVDGSWLVRDGELVGQDLSAIGADAERQLDALLARAGGPPRERF